MPQSRVPSAGLPSTQPRRDKGSGPACSGRRSRALAAPKSIGARAVIVHAVHQDVVAFYTGFGFCVFPSNPRTLFIIMDEIAAAL